MNLFLIDINIPNIHKFTESLNTNCKYIIYKNNSNTFNDINTKIKKLNNNFKNLIFVFKNEYNPADFLIEKNKGSNINSILDFIKTLIKKYSISNIDFLACNLLKSQDWINFFNTIMTENKVVIRASNNLTGNLQIGGDWILETNNTDIRQLYFNNNIEYWNFLLDTSSHTGIIDNLNNLYVAGNNAYGQLGLNDHIFKDLKNIRSLANILNDKIILNLALNNDNIAVITNEPINNVYFCGANQNGELGFSNTNKYIQYTQITLNKKIIKVAFGYKHTALITDETINNLYLTGDNTYGQLGISNDASLNVTSFQQINLNKKILDVACGKFHTAILTNDSDNNLYTCGSNEHGQLGIGLIINKKNSFTICDQFFNINLKNVSCGYNHTAVVSNEQNNNLYTCGYNLYGQLGILAQNSVNIFHKVLNLINKKVTKVSCGENHTAFLTTENLKNLYLFGNNNYGQLGYVKQNTTIPANSYKINKKILDVYCGAVTTCIITDEISNNLYIAGSNQYNLLNNINLKSTNFAFLNNIYKEKTSLIYHNYNALFILNNSKISYTNIKNDGFLLGYNNQSNYGFYFNKYIFKNPFLINNIAQISCGENHTAILTYEPIDNLYISGSNNYGQCGLFFDNNISKYVNNWIDTFTKITLGVKITNVSCGKNFTAITTNDISNNLLVCGDNTFGQLGLNNLVNTSLFKRVNLNNKFVHMISCGGNHMGLLTNDNSNNLYMCGYNAYGQLGTNNITDTSLFINVSTSSIQNKFIKQISCGLNHTIIVTTEGKAYSCGLNSSGQLGQNNSNANLKIFTLINTPNINNKFVSNVSCGNTHSLLITNETTNNLYSCGDNTNGQLGRLIDINNPIDAFSNISINISGKVIKSILASVDNSIILTDDIINNLFVCGKNQYGELGLGNSDPVSTFQQIITNNKISFINSSHNFSLKTVINSFKKKNSKNKKIIFNRTSIKTIKTTNKSTNKSIKLLKIKINKKSK